MTADERTARNAEIIRLFHQTDPKLTQKQIAERITDYSVYGTIGGTGVGMVLRRAGLCTPQIQAQTRRQRQEQRKTLTPDSPVCRPDGTPDYPEGFCLMCKGGKLKNLPSWEGGPCPTCGGTGEYPDSIMYPGRKERSCNGND